MQTLKEFLLATAIVCGCTGALGFLLSGTSLGLRYCFAQSARELLGLATLAGLLWLAISLWKK